MPRFSAADRVLQGLINQSLAALADPFPGTTMAHSTSIDHCMCVYVHNLGILGPRQGRNLLTFGIRFY